MHVGKTLRCFIPRQGNACFPHATLCNNTGVHPPFGLIYPSPIKLAVTHGYKVRSAPWQNGVGIDNEYKI